MLMFASAHTVHFAIRAAELQASHRMVYRSFWMAASRSLHLTVFATFSMSGASAMGMSSRSLQAGKKERCDEVPYFCYMSPCQSGHRQHPEPYNP